MPTAAQLNAALEEAKIDLQLDPEWDTQNNSGFWPAKFQGYDAGFEWLVEPIADAELDKRVRRRVAKFDLVVSLVTRSDMNQMASAVAVWGVLTSITDGMAFADESGDFFDPPEALKVAREQVAEPPPKREPAAQVNYPRVLDQLWPVTETRRTSHTLTLEDPQRPFRLFLETRAIPSPSVFVVTRQLEHRLGQFSVLELEVNGRTIRFTPEGRVLDPEYVPDYAALVRKLGDTESVGLALRTGGSLAAKALAAFIRDDTMDTARRRLAVITLGLMGAEALEALEVLRSMETHPELGPDATQAIRRIQGL